MSKIKKFFSKIIEKIKDLYNISFLPIWVEPSGRMTKEQEAELMKLVKEDRKKIKQKKMHVKHHKRTARQNTKQQKKQKNSKK